MFSNRSHRIIDNLLGYTKKKVLGNLQINTVAKIVIDEKEFDRKSSYEWSMVKPRKDF